MRPSGRNKMEQFFMLYPNATVSSEFDAAQNNRNMMAATKQPTTVKDTESFILSLLHPLYSTVR
jgi:hypothetical protein